MWPLCSMVEKLMRMAGDGNRFLASPDSNDSSTTRHFYSVDVPHVRQLFNWDCGLACVLMVLRTLGSTHCGVQDLEKLCPTTSIWTVDLAYLLHEYSVNFSFFTVTLGANPEYSTEAFYKEFLEADLGRVDRLFEKAVEMGINIQCRSLSGKEISGFILSGQYIFIALVNKVKLSQSWHEEMSASGDLSENTSYTGHYIVICGYNSQTNEFEIRDPASARKYERVSLECLDEARKSFGTDEDIILVSLNGKDTNSLLPQALT
ncbi:putative guanylate cyclase [Dioscorea sansibarensis]